MSDEQNGRNEFVILVGVAVIAIFALVPSVLLIVNQCRPPEVPPTITWTPTSTATATRIPTYTPTATNAPTDTPTPTNSPTATVTEQPTETPTVMPTWTQEKVTDTATPTGTPVGPEELPITGENINPWLVLAASGFLLCLGGLILVYYERRDMQ